MKLSIDSTAALADLLPDDLNLTYFWRESLDHDLAQTRVAFVCRLITSAATGSLWGHTSVPDAVALASRWVDEGLRMTGRSEGSRRERARIIDRLFERVELSDSGFLKPKGEGDATAYRVRPLVFELFDAAISRGTGFSLVDDDSGDPVVLPAYDPVAEALGITLPSVLSVSDADIQRVSDPVFARRLKLWRRVAGGIPQAYAQQDNGRIGPVKGATAKLLVVQMDGTSRTALLQGRWNYDLTACHVTIMRALGKHYGFPTPHLDAYLADRSAFAHAVSKDTGLPVADSKVLALALCNGMRMLWTQVAGKTPAFLSLCGSPEVAQKVSRHGRVKGLAVELRKIKRRALYLRPDVNVLGLRYVEKDAVEIVPGKLVVPNSRMSHLLLGIEQLAIRAVSRRAPGLLAVTYDGFVSTDSLATWKLDEIANDACREALGFAIGFTFTKERIGAVEEDATPFVPDNRWENVIAIGRRHGLNRQQTVARVGLAPAEAAEFYQYCDERRRAA